MSMRLVIWPQGPGHIVISSGKHLREMYTPSYPTFTFLTCTHNQRFKQKYIKTIEIFPTKYSICNAEKIKILCILHGQVFAIFIRFQVPRNFTRLTNL